MYFIFNTTLPVSNGDPSHNICGEDSDLLSLTNMAAQISIEGVEILNVVNLAVAAIVTPVAIGSTGLTLEEFDVNTGASRVRIKISGIKSWEEKSLEINLSKANFYSYSNTFKLFGYDLGNQAGVTTGNPDIGICLISKSGNVDADGFQQNARSKVTIYRRPFSNQVYVYSLVGTSGQIDYTNTITNEIVGGGNNCMVCSNSAVTIKQTVTLRNKYCEIVDTCEIEQESLPLVWYPSINKSFGQDLDCNTTCVSIASENRIIVTVNLNEVSTLNYDGELEFPFNAEPSPTIQKLVFEVYDYTGSIVQTEEIDVSKDYEDYIANPALAMLPTEFNFTSPDFGDVLVKVKYVIIDEATEEVTILECVQLITYESCNFWTISNDEACGDYIVKNCSLKTGTLVVSLMQEDSTFSQVSSTEIEEMSETTISLQADGIYKFTLCYEDGEETICESYIIPNNCNFQACYKDKLDSVICNPPCENCGIDIHYDFNAFLINAQTYLSLLNKELGYNYFYVGIIPTTKIAELYTLKILQDRLDEYCSSACKSTCNCS